MKPWMVHHTKHKRIHLQHTWIQAQKHRNENTNIMYHKKMHKHKRICNTSTHSVFESQITKKGFEITRVHSIQKLGLISHTEIGL
jgi:hypothetical protein